MIHTEGIVTGRTAFGNTSQIVTFFTPDAGQIACLAKGVWRQRNPLFTGPFELGRRYEMVIVPRRRSALELVIDAQELDSYRGVRRSRERLADTFFVVGVLRYTASAGTADKQGYALAVETLRRLDLNEEVVLVFLAAWLRNLGVYPNFRSCPRCRRSGGAGPWFFSFREGGITCRRHRTRESVELRPEVLSACRDPGSVPPGTRRYAAAFRLLSAWLNDLLGPRGRMVECPFYLRPQGRTVGSPPAGGR